MSKLQTMRASPVIIGVSAVHSVVAFNSLTSIVRKNAPFRQSGGIMPQTTGSQGSGTSLRISQRDPFGTIFDSVASLFPPSTRKNAASNKDEETVRAFINALNSREDPSSIVMQFFDDDINYVDTSYYNPIQGKDDLIKHFYLHTGSSALSTFTSDSLEVIVIDEIVSSTTKSEGDLSKICVMYHLASTGGKDVPDTTAISFYNLQGGKITQLFDVTEPASPKPGDGGLKLLKSVSKLIGDESIVMESTNSDSDRSNSVEKYFDAWNRRDMKDATALFAEDCKMRDLQYDEAFQGRDEFEKHLLRVKDCLPSTFNFAVDDIAISSTKAGVLWHVENKEIHLPSPEAAHFTLWMNAQD